MSAMNAAENVKNLANKLKPLMELGSYLEQIGSIEQVASEAEARCIKALGDADKAEKEAAFQVQVRKEAQVGLAQIRKEAEEIINSAQEKSAALLRIAKQKHEDAMLIIQEKKESLDKDMKKYTAVMVEVEQEIAAKRSELESVKKEIAAFKAKFLS